MRLHKKRLRYSGLHVLRHPHRIAGIANGVEQNYELIAPKSKQHGLRRHPAAFAARNLVLLPQVRSQPAANFQQHMVARAHSHSVVKYFEVIHVQEHQSVRSSRIPPRPHKGMLQPVQKQPPVG